MPVQLGESGKKKKKKPPAPPSGPSVGRGGESVKGGVTGGPPVEILQPTTQAQIDQKAIDEYVAGRDKFTASLPSLTLHAGEPVTQAPIRFGQQDIPLAVKLNARANALPADFVQKNPGEAASLLVSAVPTEQLAATARAYHEGIDWGTRQSVLDGVPGALMPYYQRAFNAPSAERRAQALVFLDRVRSFPPEEQWAYLQAHVSTFDMLTKDYNPVYVGLAVGGTAFFPLTVGLGTEGLIGKAVLGLATAPLTGKAVSETGGVLERSFGELPGVGQVARGLTTVGHGISKAPAVAGGAIRGVTGAPVAAAASLGDLVAGDPEAALRAWKDYAWDPAVYGGHAGVTKWFFNITGIDPEQHEGLAALMDLTNDIVGPVLVIRQAIKLRTSRSTPQVFGGKFTGEEYFNRGAGDRAVDAMWAARTKAIEAGADPTAWIQANSRGVNPRVARILSEAATKEEMRRAVANIVDNIPTPEDFDAVRTLIHSNNERITQSLAASTKPVTPLVMKSQVDIGKIGIDGGEFSYRIDLPESAGSINTAGFDPTFSPTGKVYFSDDPFATYKLSDRVTAQGAGGDFNIYRVRRDLTAMEQPKEWVSSERIPPGEIEVWTGEGWKSVTDGPSISDLNSITDLRAKNIALEQRLRDMNGLLDEPMMQFPRASTVRAIVNEAPRGPMTQLLSAMYSKASKVVNLEKVFNDMSLNEQRLVNPLASNKRPDWLSYNERILRNNLSLAKVSRAEQDILVREMFALEGGTRQDVFNWVNNIYRDLKNGVTRGGKRDLTYIPEATDVLRWSDQEVRQAVRSPYTVTGDIVDGRPIREVRPVLENAATGHPLPTQLNEFIGNTIDLPNIDLLRKASSSIHYWDQRARAIPVFGKLWRPIDTTLRTTRFIGFGIPRLIMRPLMFYRVHTPVVINADEMLRTVAYGLNPLRRKDWTFLPGGIPVKNVEGALARFGEDRTALGGLIERQVVEGQLQRYPVPTRGIDPNIHSDAVDVGFGIHDQLLHLSEDEIVRRVALFGPDDTLRFLDEHPNSYAGRIWTKDILPQVDAAGVQPIDFLRRKEQQIIDATGGRPDLRRAIATDKWTADVDPALHGEQVQLENLNREVVSLREAEDAARLEGNRVYGEELHQQWVKLDLKINELEHRIAGKAGKPLSLRKDRDLVMNKVVSDWREGRYEPPAEVYVTKRLAGATEDVEGGRLGSLQRKTAALSDLLYKGLGKTVLPPKLEMVGARGNMYNSLLKRNFKMLMRTGRYDAERAAQVAHYRAAFETKNVMYDLTARTSFDRATRDIFWFAPVLREQLTTWFWKIPSRAYWPIGITMELGTAHNFLEDMVNLGIGQWEERDGERTGDFILFGKFRAGSLNPVTPGGNTFIPTISPTLEKLMEFGTKKAPKELEPSLQWLSRNLTFDQGEPGVDFTPSTVDSLLNSAFALSGTYVRVPNTDQYNPTMWRNVYRQSETQSLQFAMSSLTEQGVNPPGPGATPEEIQQYEDQLRSEAMNYNRGNAFIRTIGTILSPLSIVATSSTATKYYEWKQKNSIEYPYTDADFDKIDAYLLKHPNAWPYAVGRYEASDHPLLPDDAPFSEKVLVGDITPLGGEDYINKAMARAGLAAEEARLRQELNAAGVGSAADRLANWSTYADIYAQHLIRLDDWFRGNPEIEEYLDSHSSTEFSAEDERLIDASQTLKMLREQGVFEKSGAAELKVVQGIIAQASQDISFGPPGDETAKNLEWYFNSVYNPYHDETDPLWKKVEQAFDSGNDPLGFFFLEQIKTINNRYGKITHNGENYPTPEEYSFSRLTTQEQRQRALSWAFKRPTSLTDFRQSTAGLPEFKGRELLTGMLQGIDNRFFQAVSNPHLTDDQKASLIAQHDRDVMRAGAQFGPEGITFARLTEGTPADRLVYTSYGKKSVTFMALYYEAQQIIRFAEAQGVSPRYASEASGLFAKKVDFERKIQVLRAIDPDLDRLFRRLEDPSASFGEERKLDVPLYEYLFFGQSQNAYFYQDPLVAAVERNR